MPILTTIFTIIRNSIVCAVVLLSTACASSGLFSPYPQQIGEVKNELASQQGEKALASLAKRSKSKDGVLYLMERARVAQLLGNIAESKNDFAAVITAIDKVEAKAAVSLSSLAGQSASLLSSDNTIAYNVPPYEKILVHNYQALNYLAEGNVEGAGVEVRRANLAQTEALKAYEKELTELEQEEKKDNFRAQNGSQVNSAYAGMNQAVSRLKNSIQSAYTFYVSGIIYEMLGEPNDAYIDYKKAYEIYPDNSYLNQDLLRLSKQLGFVEEFERFQSRISSKINSVQANSGAVVFLFESGYVPPRDEVRINLYTHRGIKTAAFPIYRDYNIEQQALRVSLSGEVLGFSEEIANIHLQAMKALQEKIPGMIVRQILRLVAKNELQHNANKELGGAGGLAVMLYNVLSESADLRSWLTLPRSAHILKVYLPVGTHKLRLSWGGGQDKEIEVQVRKGIPTVVHAVAAGNRFYSTVL